MNSKFLSIFIVLFTSAILHLMIKSNSENIEILNDFYESERKTSLAQRSIIKDLKKYNGADVETLDKVFRINENLVNSDPFSSKERKQIKFLLDSLNIDFSNRESNFSLISLLLKHQFTAIPHNNENDNLILAIDEINHISKDSVELRILLMHDFKYHETLSFELLNKPIDAECLIDFQNNLKHLSAIVYDSISGEYLKLN